MTDSVSLALQQFIAATFSPLAMIALAATLAGLIVLFIIAALFSLVSRFL